MTRSMMCFAVLTITLALAVENASARDSGIQFSPDGKRVFVSKDVGAERWAITLNVDDGTVSGNVYQPNGGPAAFVFCNPGSGPNLYTCFGADACPAAPCQDEFVPITEGEVALPAGFFDLPSAATASAAAPSAAEPLIASSRESGLQFSPDGTRIFVSKDVHTERWAITKNEDGSVSGNVFRPEGPAFILCTPAIVANTFNCFGADACTVAPCTDQFHQIGDGPVALPPDFFVPADAVVGAANVSDDVTEVLDVGIGVVPSAATSAATAGGPEPCPDGGTITRSALSADVVYDQCQINHLVCSGAVQRNASGLVGSLDCNQDELRKNLTLSLDLTIGSTTAGPTLDGSIEATLTKTGASAFALQYQRVVLIRSPQFHTFTGGTMTIENPNLFFGGFFTQIDQEFDGSQFILIRKFFPKADGTIQVLVLRLDVTTGKLTAN
ncbi:MAG: hypothetical protein HY271_12010 [Deltaproteobacteria bacterium]|nr:hypothetical protein [Deltaproteobacteria bacterium]